MTFGKEQFARNEFRARETRCIVLPIGQDIKYLEKRWARFLSWGTMLHELETDFGWAIHIVEP